jgi:hypothetical protein
MSNLAELRDLVELDLDDSSNAVWSTGDVDRAIARALYEYSQVNPQRTTGTITVSADGREISISSLAGLTRMVRVWHPYTAADPEDPPEWRRWDLWGTTLRVIDGDEPASGEVVRVFYFKEHTINGLGGASSTTVAAEDERVVVLGAGAYAALQKARSAIGEAGVSTETPEHWLKWALSRMEAFSQALASVRARELRRVDRRVPLDRDGWERDETREVI